MLRILRLCRRSGWLVAVGVLSCGLSKPALAFESNEHLFMSNAALRIAMAHAGSLPQSVRPTKALHAADRLLEQYGTLTECVDYFLYPEKMLSYAMKPGPHASEPVQDTVLPDGQAAVIPSALIEQCRKQGAQYIQASHSNHAHFQQDLIVSIRLYHALAVSVARTEGNHYAALALNAIADHYLQDYFAPGHLVTPRDRLTDLPATAMHDLANQMGAIFYPQIEAVLPVLEFLCNMPLRIGVTPECSPTAQVLPVLQAIGLQQVNLGPLLRDMLDGKPVLFRGDGQLTRPAQDAQRLLLLAVQTQSIEDVLLESNSMRSFSFAYDLGQGLPMASSSFGRYDFSQQGQPIAPLLAANVAPEAIIDSRAGRSTGQSSLLTVCSFGHCDNELYTLRTRSPVLSLSYQRESESTGVHEARDVWTVEVTPFGRYVDLSKASGGMLTGVEMAPAFGYLHYRHGRRSGHGPSLRLPVYVPETEFSVGPYLRWLDYTDGTENVRRLSYGLRMDAGFSTYATFFLGVGIDHANSDGNQLRRMTLWTAGLRLGFPLTRIAF